MAVTITARPTPSEVLAGPFGAFTDALQAHINVALTSTLMEGVSGNHWPNGEYDVLVLGSTMYGVSHEEIATLLEIAKRHDGRLWCDHKTGKLAILFRYDNTPGPEPVEEQAPAETARRTARGLPQVKSKAKAKKTKAAA
jgi:hypothetical protein